MNKRARWLTARVSSLVVILLSVCALYVVHHAIVANSDQFFSAPAVETVSSDKSPFSLLAQIDEVISATRPSLSPEIESYSTAGNFRGAKDALLKRALDSVAAGDNQALALNLGELGELALQQGELGVAEVYFSESLELYQELADDVNVAGIHLQMGRLHLYARQRARRSSDAYDQLLLSRWMISQGRFDETEDQLKQVVQSNLELKRFGAAASAYETLFSGYSAQSDLIGAQQAGVEAIKLHAASGNLGAANGLLTKLEANGLSRVDATAINRLMQHHYRDYEAGVQAVGAARDYAQLYNQLSSKGDALQAWRFRQQAELSLADAPGRARYRRQPDVLVELYRSNVSMDQAIRSLQQADAVYSRYGISEGVERSRQLRAQIY